MSSVSSEIRCHLKSFPVVNCYCSLTRAELVIFCPWRVHKKGFEAILNGDEVFVKAYGHPINFIPMLVKPMGVRSNFCGKHKNNLSVKQNTSWVLLKSSDALINL